MGVILNGVLGGFSGKVGPVVGGKWKDIDYMRAYVVPANPNTSGQQAVRAKFSQLVSYARSILSQILQPYWDPFLSNMSGFNSWISQNYENADADGIIDDTAIMALGTLTPTPLLTATYDTADGDIVITWSPVPIGNQAVTDYAVPIAYDTDGNQLTVGSAYPLRSATTANMTIDSGLTATEVIVFVFFFQGTGAEMIVSDSVSKVCAAA